MTLVPGAATGLRAAPKNLFQKLQKPNGDHGFLSQDDGGTESSGPVTWVLFSKLYLKNPLKSRYDTINVPRGVSNRWGKCWPSLGLRSRHKATFNEKNFRTAL